MKKIIVLLTAAVFAFAMMGLTACGTSIFGIDGNSEKAMTVNAENAKKKDSVITGILKVGKKDEIQIRSALEKGTVKLSFISAEGMDDIDKMPDFDAMADNDPVVTAETSGDDVQSFQINKGDYLVKATVLEKATGIIKINVNRIITEDWKQADSTEEAAEKAGLDGFEADPSKTSLGKVLNEEFYYMDDIAQAFYGIAAVNLFIYKGSASINGGDISFDSEIYKNEWTEKIDGKEVKCFGNREGEATKTIWTDGDYAYAILAYGAGGDVDYGFSKEDLTTVVKTVK